MDLESPTPEEVKQVVDAYQIHPLVANELTMPTIRPKVDLYRNFIYLILHFPSLHRKADDQLDQEVDFVIGKDFIITARYGEVDALTAFAKEFEVESVLEKGVLGEHAGFIFFAMMKRIYDSILHQIESVKDSIARIESEVFKGKEREMVGKISEISRDLLDFRRSTSLHKEILESFDVAALRLFGDDFKFHSRVMIGNYYKVDSAITNCLEFVAELRETNNSLLSTKQNQVTQALTVIAFIALPLTVITSLFQIDTKARPIVGADYDFWILVSMQVIVAAFLYIFFKKKKWL